MANEQKIADEMSEEKLESCPLSKCGGEVIMVESRPFQIHLKWHTFFGVECKNCGLSVTHKDKQKLIDLWNTRTNVADEIIAMLESEVSDETA